jgi:hypothetical protein
VRLLTLCLLVCGVTGDNATLIVAGNVSVNVASIVGALEATANGSASFETLEFNAPISGSAGLQVSGASLFPVGSPRDCKFILKTLIQASHLV